jgi:hypothetical protein
MQQGVGGGRLEGIEGVAALEIGHPVGEGASALAEGRAYPEPYGVAEALWLDQEGAWLGLDNNDLARADGEGRPLLWQFKAPAGGWSAP